MHGPRRRWLGFVAIGVIVVAVVWAAGSFLMVQGVEEYYSRGWQSTDTQDAKRRGVFVTAPIVVPAAVPVCDSVEARVTDAWIERPTHVKYRWHLVRRVVADSGYRLILHLANGPVSGQPSTSQTRRCFSSVDFYVDDRPAGNRGDFTTDELHVASNSPFPDTVRLRSVRRDSVSLAPKAAPLHVPNRP